MFKMPTSSLLRKAGVGRKVPFGVRFPILMLITGLLLGSRSTLAQFASNGTGGGAWTSASTWAGGQVPPPNANVTIAANDSVWTNIGGVVTCGGLDIQSGAKLNVLGSGIQMSGPFTIEAGAKYINNTDSARAWPAGATVYTIDPQSTFELGNAGSSTLGWSRSDSTFGNVIIDPNAAGGITCGANLTIQGNLIINAGQGKVFRGISAGIASSQGVTAFVHHVMGNVTVVSGNWSAVDMGVSATTPLSCTWNIDGNVIVGDPSGTGARFSPITSEDDLGATGIFNIKGNLSFTNGGRLAAGSNSGSSQSPAQIAKINIYGNLSFDSTATFAVNSNGNFIINFKGSKPQTVFLGTNVSFSHSGPPQCSLWDTVATGANVTFTGGHVWRTTQTSAPNGGGAFVVNGTLNLGAADTIEGEQKFVLSPGGTLGIGSPDGIVASTDAHPNSGNIEVDAERIFSNSANYVYNGTSAQVTGSGLPTTVNDLTINNPAGVTLSQATTINGTLHLKAGTFDNTIPFTLGPNGKISYEGGQLKIPTAVNLASSTVPKQFLLEQNYPNPFNPTTEIQFAIPENVHVTLTIYDYLGQKVATLVDRNLTAGVYRQVFDGSQYAGGMYFAKLVAGTHVMVDKMLMIK